MTRQPVGVIPGSRVLGSPSRVSSAVRRAASRVTSVSSMLCRARRAPAVRRGPDPNTRARITPRRPESLNAHAPANGEGRAVCTPAPSQAPPEAASPSAWFVSRPRLLPGRRSSPTKNFRAEKLIDKKFPSGEAHRQKTSERRSSPKTSERRSSPTKNFRAEKLTNKKFPSGEAHQQGARSRRCCSWPPSDSPPESAVECPAPSNAPRPHSLTPDSRPVTRTAALQLGQVALQPGQPPCNSDKSACNSDSRPGPPCNSEALSIRQ